MKKLIAVLAFLAIVTMAAHAQASLNGVIRFHGHIVNNDGNPWTGSPDEHSFMQDTLSRFFAHEARIGMNVGNGEGTAGGGLRMWIDATNHERTDAWVWWQPLDSLRLWAGRDPWRILGGADIVGWGFYGGAAGNAEDVFMRWGWAGAAHYGPTMAGRRLGRVAGFYGGFGGTGLSATFRPSMDLPLTVIAVLPWSDVDNEMSVVDHVIANTFLNAHLGIRYTFAGIGNLSFTWWGAPGDWGWNSGDTALPMAGLSVGNGVNQTNSSRFFLAFHLNQLPALSQMGIQMNLGLVYTLPFSTWGVTEEDDLLHHFPIEVGFGFLFSQGPLRFAARFAGTFGGSVDGDAVPALLGFNIHPSFNLGFMTLHLAAGFQFLAENGDSNFGSNHDSYLGWHVAPFISRTIAGPTRMMAGIHIESNGTQNDRGDTQLIWRVPIGIELEW